ncbi:Beta-lactamase/transpeptidase-like protein [Akanthomyces lecanii RCEF 1005]|uniref:Beta-lactamase/transpeptidase-like protein n=1 Tax=Akanthomyces lecanii RCEF 1005 TaxID=1081108 RepID=A0A162KMT7_CORDF|nr:Beta-lactamase/transpeptidase-like protein [Akanthomyces lecanii RCEF 1005]
MPPSRTSNVSSFKLRYLARKLFRPKQPASFSEIGLFTGKPQHEYFCQVDNLAPVSRMPVSSTPYVWPTGPTVSIPASYDFKGSTKSAEDFLIDTDTAALLVFVDGQVRYERYLLTGGPKVNWLSMSVAKSFVSCLVGIAVDEGFIASIKEPISKYVPVQPKTAYDGVSIKDVLHMSSGARWNEDYSDRDSEIFQINQAILGKGSGLDGFVARMARESAPDTVCRYNSGETQILGALIAHATNRSVTEYMTDKLIQPLGFESPSFWVTDMLGTEMVYAGLNMTARDFAKLGELYRNDGMWQGKRIISASWIRESTTIDSPIREAGQPIVGGHSFDLGYGYQWWIPAGHKGDYCAIGVLNQLVYVNPDKNTTIVKLSANRKYGTSPREDTNRDSENVEFLRAIAASI